MDHSVDFCLYFAIIAITAYLAVTYIVGPLLKILAFLLFSLVYFLKWSLYFLPGWLIALAIPGKTDQMILLGGTAVAALVNAILEYPNSDQSASSSKRTPKG